MFRRNPVGSDQLGLNPEMNGWGTFEALRQKAEQLRAEREAAQPIQPQWTPDSMEWLAEQKKSSLNRGGSCKGIVGGTERCYGAGGEEWQLRRCI
jgi:hypothetical protein